MKRKLVYLFLAAVCAIAIPFGAAGCSNKKNVLKINEVTHSIFYAPLYLADALGYFEDEGFEIELTNGGGADNTMAAVLSGSADVGFCGPEAAIYVEIGGSTDQPMVFGQLTKRDGSFLVGRQPEPEFDWKNLEGKELLAGRPGGVPFMTFSYVLHEHGVSATYKQDVDFNYMTAAFIGGAADYVTAFEPVASQMQAAGQGYIVASVGAEAGEIPYTCFMAKQSYIDANGDKIEGLLRGVTKAIKYLDTANLDEAAELLTDYFPDTSAESIKTSLQSYISIDAWVKNMAMEEQAFTRLQDVIELAGQLERRVKFANVVQTEVARKVYKEIYA